MKKKLYVVGQGIGNMVETVYTFMKLKEHFNDNIDVCYNHRTNIDGSIEKMEFYKIITARYGMETHLATDYVLPDEIKNQYSGQILSVWVQPIQGIPVLAKPTTGYTNEVSRNNSVLQVLGIDDNPNQGMEKFKLDWFKYSWTHKYDVPKYDIIINDGGFQTEKWKRKHYAFWNEVAMELFNSQKYSIAFVGHPTERLLYGDDLTGLNLLDTMDAVANAKLFLCNDSGLYHFASACGVRNLVMFTATNIRKNWNKIFHRSSYVLHTRLGCQPCQVDTWGWSNAFNKCTEFKCCEYPTELFLKFIDAEMEQIAFREAHDFSQAEGDEF